LKDGGKKKGRKGKDGHREKEGSKGFVGGSGVVLGLWQVEGRGAQNNNEPARRENCH